jgi:pSer/pThr/pTyr-binding forkhead associated (FHA) protein
MNPPGAAWLVDDLWAKAYRLGAETTIGRGASSTIILRDPAVSRVHAEVRIEADAFVLHAQGTSGTKLNGLPVTAGSVLHEGDVVEIAYTNLRFTTKPPTTEMSVLPRDTPTPIDSVEGPTRATLRAIKRSPFFGKRQQSWRRFWRWLTRRPNTD